MYEAMGAHGFGPREVDGMELWEAAAILGVNHAEPATATAPTGPRDLVAERLAAKAGLAPPPKPDRPAPLPPQVVDMFRRKREREAAG
jgi:hypothetical protein